MTDIYLTTDEVNKIYDDTIYYLEELGLYTNILVVCEQCGDIQLIQYEGQYNEEIHNFIDELLESPTDLNWFYADGMWLCDKCSGITYNNEYLLELTEENIFEL